MASPLSVAHNDYRRHPKRDDIETPPGVARYLASLFPDAARVLDPCAGAGALLAPFRARAATCIEYELSRGRDFFAETGQLSVDLVVCNPPFNAGCGRRLAAEAWMDNILRVVGYQTEIALFTPMGLRLNQRKASARWRKMRDAWPRITSIIALPLDVFPSVLFHCEIVLFNAPHLEPHLFLPDWAI